MQTLDLSGQAKKSDGPIKSLLWPTVENAWDVDYLGQQGFWLCLFIALLSLLLVSFTASQTNIPIARAVMILAGLIECLVYFVGGMGVRQASWPAAAMVFALYSLEHLLMGQIGVLTIIVGAVLLSNVRATFLAAKWKPAADDDDRPMRFNETFRDRLVDQLPPRAWPILKYPFYFFASVILLLVLANSALRMHHPRSPQVPDETNVPSLTVSPTQNQQ